MTVAIIVEEGMFYLLVDVICSKDSEIVVFFCDSFEIEFYVVVAFTGEVIHWDALSVREIMDYALGVTYTGVAHDWN